MLVFYHARPSRRGVTGRRLHVVSELGFDISRTGYTVSLVPRDRLPHANALIEGANAIGEGIGPSVGGWLFDTLGVALSLLFDFVTYVCSSLLVLLNVLERRKRKTAAASEHTPRQDESARVKTDDENDDDGDVLSGLRFVWGNGIIRSIAFSTGQFNFFTAAFFTIYYVFVVRVLHMDHVAVGLAATCSGIGGIVSSVAAGALIRRMASGPPVHRHAVRARLGAARAAVGPHNRVRQRRGDRIGMRLPVRVELHRDGEPRPERIHQTGHRPGTAARAGQLGGARHRPGSRAHRRAGGRTVRGHDRRGHRPVPVRGGTGRIHGLGVGRTRDPVLP
ncbi:MFS transporter [Bifidobacterium pullorum subsp. saeculare]|nr:MFS transporter [Bifidobacterium pullorum subsp. saeculare]